MTDVVSESEQNRIRNEIRRLRLAASDMEQVASAAETLAEVRLNEGAERTMHTGIVVTYVRPFKNTGIGSLDAAEWGPKDPSDRKIHDAVVALRDKVYAHTDRTQLRDVEDTSALLGFKGGPTYAEASVSLSSAGLTRIGSIAAAQAKRFDEAADELEFKLGRRRPGALGDEFYEQLAPDEERGSGQD
jgi:hypothetical protein